MMKTEKLHVPREKYLSAGVHIGMTSRTADMKRFIYKIRPNGLAVLNVGMLDKRIGYVADMLAPMKKIMVVSRKENGQESAKKFAEVIGGRSIVGRFMPGSLTNPTYEEFFEPEVLIVTDPMADRQAMKEAITMRIPIIGFADTFNETSFLDVVLPCNNKGRKSVALVYWLLAKLILEKRNEGKDFKFDMTPEDFGYRD
jgi:small subunit ribosomal protein S2